MLSPDRPALAAVVDEAVPRVDLTIEEIPDDAFTVEGTPTHRAWVAKRRLASEVLTVMDQFGTPARR